MAGGDGTSLSNEEIKHKILTFGYVLRADGTIMLEEILQNLLERIIKLENPPKHYKFDPPANFKSPLG